MNGCIVHGRASDEVPCAECDRQERLLTADPTEEWVADEWAHATDHPHRPRLDVERLAIALLRLGVGVIQDGDDIATTIFDVGGFGDSGEMTAQGFAELIAREYAAVEGGPA